MKNTIKTTIATLLLTLTFLASGRAIWTGRSVEVRTVTGRYAKNCEYEYAGQKFWKVFETKCEPYIEVW